MADGEGFEPPEALTSTVFKTAAIDHSATHPDRRFLARLARRRKREGHFDHASKSCFELLMED